MKRSKGVPPSTCGNLTARRISIGTDGDRVAWILLVILLSLIATVLALPRVRAIRRMAGVGDENPHSAPTDYVFVPSQFGWTEEEPPSRILTANYRDRWVRPIAMTSDTAGISVPASFRSVSVIPKWDEAVEEVLKRYGPGQIELYFPEDMAEGNESPPHESTLERRVPQDPRGLVPMGRSAAESTARDKLTEVARHGMAVGDSCLALATAKGIRESDQAVSLRELPAPAQG
jgi:hypothetical protein